MARIRSIEERIIEMREKLRVLQDRKRLRDMQNRLRSRVGKRKRRRA